MADGDSPGQGQAPFLTPAQRAELLSIARQSLQDYLRRGIAPAYRVEDPELEKPGAAFVTLTREGRLRGCIGYTEPLYPLHQTVSRCALAAATEDFRFPAVVGEELDQLLVCISVLSPLRKIATPEQIEVGRHGLLVAKDRRRGLLLPQVPTEQGWDRETFLRETCRKAGLSDGAWTEEDVELFVFEAHVFAEEEKKPSSPPPSLASRS